MEISKLLPITTCTLSLVALSLSIVAFTTSPGSPGVASVSPHEHSSDATSHVHPEPSVESVDLSPYVLKPGLSPDGVSKMNDVLARVTSNGVYDVPGAVVYAKRGDTVYHNSAGVLDLESGAPMPTDALFRMYSMTKFVISTVALMGYEQGWFKFDTPLGDIIPSFQKTFDVISPAAEGDPGAEAVTFAPGFTGEATQFWFTRAAATEPIRIKHLFSEAAGVGYDLWGDFGFGSQFYVATALRQSVNPNFPRTTGILGGDLTLEEFCDTVAEAGVLVSEPGVQNYGHGASLLGRVIEVKYNEMMQTSLSLNEILRTLLFEPLGMDRTDFHVTDEAEIAKIPTYYFDAGDNVNIRYEEAWAVPNSGQTEHYEGPMKFESGDTGLIMPLSDYGKFLSFLTAGGTTPSGVRLLSSSLVKTIYRKEIASAATSTGVLAAFGFDGENSPRVGSKFTFGLVCTGPFSTVREVDLAEDDPAVCTWGGLAGTQFFWWPEEDAFIVIGVQTFFSSANLSPAVRHPLIKAFKDAWN